MKENISFKICIIFAFFGLIFPTFYLMGNPPSNALRQNIIETAKQYQGIPYVYGGISTAGFDCSGFICFVYRNAADMQLPRTSKNMWSIGRSINLSEAQPGDVIVFDTVGGVPSHVAILMDDNNMIHAVSDGPKTGVIISSLQDRYFAPRIIGVRSFFLAEEYPIENQPERSEPVISDNPAETEIPTESWLPTESGLPTESLGFTITNESVTYIDKIPAVTGSGIRFAITNGTEQNGTFEILFYKMDPVFSNIKTLYQTRVHIDEGKMIETDPFIFTEPGQYKLILKTGSNLKRVERIWQVVEQ